MRTMNSSSRCLITGGAGFIGSHLAEHLLERSACVTVLDSSRGPGTLLFAKNLQRHLEYRVGDVRRPRDLDFIGRGRFDVVFHLAAQPISTLSNSDAETTFATNVDGTRNVCAALKEAGGGCLVLSSSACVYGRPDIGASPLREEDSLNSGFYLYSESKQAAEIIVRQATGVRGIIGRFVNVYGPGDRHFSRIVPRTVRQLLRRESLRLSRGNGATVLDFLYIDDAVAALEALAGYVNAPSGQPAADVFNFGIGVDHALSITELVSKICLSFDGAPRSLDAPECPTEPAMVKFLDSSKARRTLGWIPGTRLEQGLPPTIAWYRESLTAVEPLEDLSLAAGSVGTFQ